MVYFKKTDTEPPSLSIEFAKANGSYKGQDVLDQLYLDFYNKCYICESKNIESINIEHFAPHKEVNKIRKFAWRNLFWACSHCNQIKSATEPFLNCIIAEDNVDTNIKYEIDDNLQDNKIIIQALATSIEINNTVSLLTNVYNGTTIQNKFQAKAKRNNIYDELCNFSSNVLKYFRIEDGRKKGQYLQSIVCDLTNESEFTAFKRYYIRSNPRFNSLNRLVG